MSKITIEIDLDGVFFDFHSVFEKEIQRKYPEFTLSNLLTYDFNKSLKCASKDVLVEEFGGDVARSILIGNSDLLGAPRKEVIKALSNYRLFEDAKPYGGAVESVKALIKTGLFDIVFNSYAGRDCPESEQISRVKHSRMQEIFKDLPINLIATIGDGKPVLSNSAIVIEDNISHLRKYPKAGRYLINQPFNQTRFLPKGENLDGIFRVGSLEDAINGYIL